MTRRPDPADRPAASDEADLANVDRGEPREGLRFADLKRANRSRVERWHPGFPADDGWTGADWSNAMLGEAGEAANVVKKLRRIETGQLSKRTDESQAVDDLKAKLADEIGDVATYLDLLAQFYGLDLATCVAMKFDKISEREGMPERIGHLLDGQQP